MQLIMAAPQSNNLIYEGGTTQVSSDIDEYDNITSGTPITGSVMVTHDKKNIVDPNSFRLGSKPIKVNFVQSASMDGILEVSIYKFQLEGMQKGSYTLPPITVKVDGKDYQAPPMTIEVSR